MQWTVGHSISGTWNHGILEGIVTIYITKEKLIAVEGMVKENCFHGPVIVINVQLAQVGIVFLNTHNCYSECSAF